MAEMVRLECPGCNASLEAAKGLDEFICPYCGTRMLIAIDSANRYWAQARIREIEQHTVEHGMNLEHDERVKAAEREWKLKLLEDSRKSLSFYMKWMLILVVVIFLIGAFLEMHAKGML